MAVDADALRSNSRAQEVEEVIVADGIVVVVSGTCAQCINSVQRPVGIGGIGNIVVGDGVVVVTGSTGGGAEKNNPRCGVGRGTFQRTVSHGIVGGIVDELDGRGSCSGEGTGVGNGEAFGTARGIFTSVDDYVVGTIEVDQRGCQITGYTQSGGSWINNDSGVIWRGGGQCSTGIQSGRGRFSRARIDFNDNIALVSTRIDGIKGTFERGKGTVSGSGTGCEGYLLCITSQGTNCQQAG